MNSYDNPLEYGTVGKDGDTHVTNYAWLDVDIDGVTITNIPLNEDSTRKIEEHPLHYSGFNCYVKSFSCTRAVPKGIDGFWNAAGGGMECSLTVFDPTFIQFEQLVMEKVKHQKVHCRISYGISQNGTNFVPAPFELHCLITKMDESITAVGAEWNLTLNTTPPEFFDTYPDIGSKHKKETCYNLGKDETYKRVSDLVKKLLEEENWKGIVIKSKELKKKSIKIPTKDISSRIDLIRLKLAPMAQCEDNNHEDAYHLMVGLDGSVYFMPFGMTIKDALESELAEKVNNFDIKTELKTETERLNAIKESIEQLNMRDYISEDNGRLTLKYGFKNSIVQSFNVNYDCMSMVTQYYYDFYWKDESGEDKHFEMPELSDKQKKDLGKIVKNNKVYLWDTNEDDAKETAKSIIRKLHIVDYQGSATLINWPYIMPMQMITFQYMIPSGSKMALNASNTNKPNEIESEVIKDKFEYSNRDASFSERSSFNNDITKETKNNKNNKISLKQEVTLEELEKSSKERQKSKRSKLKGNSQYFNGDNNTDNQFKKNVGIPTSLGSWNDEHKSSVIYLVRSIKDTIEGGIITSDLELTALFADSFPQINESLKNN